MRVMRANTEVKVGFHTAGIQFVCNITRIQTAASDNRESVRGRKTNEQQQENRQRVEREPEPTVIWTK